MIRTAMPRTIIKLALSAAVAATLTLSPAQARNDSSGDDSAAIIAALLGLVTLGVILSGDDKPSAGGDHFVHTPMPTFPKPHRPKPPKVSKFHKLPAHCLRTFKTQTGRQKLFARRCLQKNFAFAHELPSTCAKSVVIRNRKGVFVQRHGYRPKCLRARGYRAAQNH
ncbi:hypothetical protein SAMN04488030_2811 [Aliiroseovarius halocynthiae]|uniref:UrcA family protein n=1 Tax=Aliiroseovarius halocynthiae TaxID=985055 RepID=A0A545SNW7_9RHOB|nr:hypothetical protein [Aliiroseovarius halocynthiae]TQV66665.1 hypothetical protein FIL88_13145 [Aliiroseovarius halocynthiae]SMR82458.1 hypothetical protein SAMN04488030_2811 [Aliiroseovarius halocynthiae]